MRNLTVRTLITISILFFLTVSGQVSDIKISGLNGKVKKVVHVHYDTLKNEGTVLKLKDTLNYNFKSTSYYDDSGNLDSSISHLIFTRDCVFIAHTIYKMLDLKNLKITEYFSLYYPKKNIYVPTDTVMKSVFYLSKRKYRITSSNPKMNSRTVTTTWLDKRYRVHKSKTIRWSNNKIYSQIEEKTKYFRSNPYKILTSRDPKTKLRILIEWNVQNVDAFDNPIETLIVKTDYNQKILKKIILTTVEYR